MGRLWRKRLLWVLGSNREGGGGRDGEVVMGLKLMEVLRVGRDDGECCW